MHRSLRSSLTALSFAALIAAASALTPSVGHAESGEFNLHLDLGPGLPLAGPLVPTSGDYPIGAAGYFSFDWQAFTPLALEAIVGGGYIAGPTFNYAGVDPGPEGTPMFMVAVGARLRFLDNSEGYYFDQDGDIWGNFWASAHLGFHYFDGPQFGVDIGVGYEWSVIRPLQIGVFGRATILPGGDGDDVDALLVVGINGSIELGETQIVDTDGDTLTDEREQRETRTDPTNPDTDGDRINDGIEVNTGTNPLNPDTDGDGAPDGVEDRNQNGSVDLEESDPRVPDTDHGGVPDPYELEHGMNAQDASDDDADNDHVLQNVDACPNSPEGADVDERGCTIIRERMVLDGIQFGYNSAEILPDSERTLQQALAALRDNPDVRVEIGGHTDNAGSNRYNLDLSRQRADAVRAWMVEHGIDPARMETRGYGERQPVAPNTTDEGRARNRRIEFRRLDSGGE